MSETEKEKGSLDLQVGVDTVNSVDGDEALRLVGTVRTAQFSEEYNLKLRRKMDWLIPPLCAAVYFTQFLDKTSLNYASIMGLPITGQKYNLVSAAFYFGFLVFEFPTVYISQKLRVAKYLGVNIVLWGIILMLHSVGTSFGAFFALRFLLGMCESCVAPILILIISMFYKKNEQASRISWFYVMNGLTQVFGGFVAYGISFYSGTRLAPYKIIYILLGALAILVGIAVLIWLPDSPVHAQFLDKEERIAALERVRDDQGGTENHKLKKDQVIEALLDVRTWLIVLTTLLTSIPNGGLSNYSNIIIRNFGYTSKQTLILSTPGGVVAAITTLLCGWYSDKKGERMLPIIFALVPTIVGTAMLIGLNNSHMKGALLFGVYLIGTFGSALSTVYAYNASNTSGHTKKSTINAMTLVTFAVGNIIGTQIFQPKDAPGYIPGKITVLVTLTVQLAVSLLLRWINLRLNVKKRAKLAEVKAQHGWSDADLQRERDKHAFADLTDRQNMFFIYTA
ncbi:MFS general substrate transporter [Mycena maculata]|uniref:MFS general substrate transporter n=1 Tax=Mycena maculata TaxID=230809 RepID=A0AAD7N4W4_9AGAR|nr:MFS general substrate transporter [Mycena maculata]